jgi:hypothetical protein
MTSNQLLRLAPSTSSIFRQNKNWTMTDLHCTLKPRMDMYNLTWAQDVINKQASTVIEQNSAMCVFYMLAFTSLTINSRPY